MHNLIVGLIQKANTVSWIDLGICPERVKKIVGKEFYYFEQGSPKALEVIFDIEAENPIKLEKPWQEKVDEVISSFQKNSLAHIAADLCLIGYNKLSFNLIEHIHKKLDLNHQFDIFHFRRRQIQILFRTPSHNSSNSINNHLNTLSKVSTLCDDRTLRNKIDLFIANTIWKVNNPLKSVELLRSIISNFDENSIEYIELNILMGIAKVYSGAELFIEGITQIKYARDLANQFQYPIQEAEASLRLSIALMRGNSPKKSEEELLKSKPIFEEIGDHRQLFTWQLNLAESYRNQRKLHESLPVLEDLIEKTTLSEDMEVLLNARGNIGLVYISIGKLIEGDQEFSKVIEITNDIETSQEAKGNALYNRGWLRVICCSWKEAIPFFDSAASSYTVDFYSPERKGGALSLMGVANYFLNKNEKSRALLNFIDENNLVPSGNMHSDYKLLNFLLSNDISIEIINRAKNDFSGEPEQLFYILFMLLKEEIDNRKLLDECILCAKEAKFVSYWELLKQHIYKFEIDIEPKKLKTIEDNTLDNFKFIGDLMT